MRETILSYLSPPELDRKATIIITPGTTKPNLCAFGYNLKI